MKKEELIVALALALICIVFIAFRVVTQDAGDQVVVTVNGQEYGSYSLNKDQTVDINGTNVLTISEGKAWISEATCSNQVCVMMGEISQDGAMIVCLPNRVVVEVVAAE